MDRKKSLFNSLKKYAVYLPLHIEIFLNFKTNSETFLQACVNKNATRLAKLHHYGRLMKFYKHQYKIL